MTPDQAYERFKVDRPVYEELAVKLTEDLRVLLARWGVAFDHVTNRVKGLDEFREKILRKKYDDPFKQCEDLCGLRVVTLYDTDVDRVVTHLAEDARDAFPEQRVEDKRPARSKHVGKDPFGYSSVHVIVRTRDAPDKPVEIQIRTIMQHGWAQIEHKLRYALERSKGSSKSNVAREFQRLAALLELADESFIRLRDAGREAANQPSTLVRSAGARKSTPKRDHRVSPEPTWLEEAPTSNQRDVAWHSDSFVWAQEGPDDLRLRFRSEDGTVRWLTPQGKKEYMSRMDSRYVVAYRQPGGVVLYDLASSDIPVLLTRGGCPSGVANGLVVVQGEGTTDGIGGGISLYRTDKTLVKRLSEKGCSAKFDGTSIVWQEHPDLVISHPPYADHQVLANSASHASIHNRLVTWVVSGRSPIIRGLDLETGDRYQIDRPGTFQHVRDFRVAYLTPTEGRDYDLIVRDLLLEKDILHIRSAGFPRGRGPQFCGRHVVWESTRPDGHMNLLTMTLPPAAWSYVTSAVEAAFAPCQRLMDELAAGFEQTPVASAHILGILKIHLQCIENAVLAMKKKRPSGSKLRNEVLWRILRRVATDRRVILWNYLARFPNIPMPERDWEAGIRLIGARVLAPEH